MDTRRFAANTVKVLEFTAPVGATESLTWMGAARLSLLSDQLLLVVFGLIILFFSFTLTAFV